MNARLKMGKVQPAAYKAMDALDSYVKQTDINPLHRELIKIRASQINGCAYCLDEHSRDARKLGETEQRIYILSAWREAKNLFNEQEQAILELTEEVTRISEHGVSEEIYNNAIRLFGEKVTAQLYMAIITINAWNRIGVGLHMQPE
jgi:AhpD family alkylhydroperoxidase